MNISLQEFGWLVLDFDGVFTDNKVYVSESGQETVCCNRGDGLGLNILRNWLGRNNIQLETLIISTEKNMVVSARAKKLGVKCMQGIEDKARCVKDIKRSDATDSKIVFIGNDLNDIEAMRLCDYVACPRDAHPWVKQESDLILNSKGGEGCIREFIEKVLKLDKEEAIGLL